MNSLKWKERKGGKEAEREKEREGGVRERESDEESMRERWGNEWLRIRGRLLKRKSEKMS